MILKSSHTGTGARPPGCPVCSALPMTVNTAPRVYRLFRTPRATRLSGKRAVGRQLSDDVNAKHIGSLLLYHYPTTWNHILGDHAISFRVLPLGPDETQVTTKWLVHKDAVEGVDYNIEELTHVWLETNDQDRRIVEENAFGIRSPAYEPGPIRSSMRAACCSSSNGTAMRWKPGSPATPNSAR